MCQNDFFGTQFEILTAHCKLKVKTLILLVYLLIVYVIVSKGLKVICEIQHSLVAINQFTALTQNFLLFHKIFDQNPQR